MIIETHPTFDLHATINSHGWYDLPPFSSNASLTELRSVISLSPSKHAVIGIRAQNSALDVRTLAPVRLTVTEKERIKNSVRSMLRMDEPLQEFYALCRSEPHLRWVPKRRAGRMLRSPTLFEDVVKMLFTTNCSWSLTKIQTGRLCSTLGTKCGDGLSTFPEASAIAKKSERWLRANLSCGYRAPYLLELCRNVDNRSIELESLRQSPLPTEELYRILRSIKGIGHYAAGNILKLLGRYDYLGIDSWVRERFSQIHRKGRRCSDAAIEKHYHRYGKWRGLVCLMEVTSDWHT